MSKGVTELTEALWNHKHILLKVFFIISQASPGRRSADVWRKTRLMVDPSNLPPPFHLFIYFVLFSPLFPHLSHLSFLGLVHWQRWDTMAGRGLGCQRHLSLSPSPGDFAKCVSEHRWDGLYVSSVNRFPAVSFSFSPLALSMDPYNSSVCKALLA